MLGWRKMDIALIEIQIEAIENSENSQDENTELRMAYCASMSGQ